MILSDYRVKLEQAIGTQKHIKKELDNIITEETHRLLQVKYIEEAQALIQTTAKETQEQLRYHIEDIVNTALDTCFTGEYTFKIDFQIKRGKTEAELYLLKEGEKIDPMEASGGGVVDVVSFALRLSAWALSKTDNIIVLDEPFKFLSVDLRPMAGEILKRLSEKLRLQIIMVTHDKEMIETADKVFEVIQEKGRSKITVGGGV